MTKQKDFTWQEHCSLVCYLARSLKIRHWLNCPLKVTFYVHYWVDWIAAVKRNVTDSVLVCGHLSSKERDFQTSVLVKNSVINTGRWNTSIHYMLWTLALQMLNPPPHNILNSSTFWNEIVKLSHILQLSEMKYILFVEDKIFCMLCKLSIVFFYCCTARSVS